MNHSQRSTSGTVTEKPIATISLDLDNKWSYLKSHDDPKWESFPSYLDVVVPRILRMLDELEMKITFFIVGQDAVIEGNREALKMIADAGHEVGNHSFHHEPCLHLYTPDQLEREFELSEKAIEDMTGRRTVGFRGPGFSLSDQTLKTLLRRGYKYDCTTFPTFLAPLARAFYFLTGSFDREQKREREAMFGKLSDGFLPNSPYMWQLEDGDLLEIPVTTFPGVKAPVHATYLHYLASYSDLAATAYFATALSTLKLCGVAPSFLLHPLDFLGLDDEPDLDFFPGMKVESETKLDRIRKYLEMYRAKFDVITLRQFADIALSKELDRKSIRFARSGVTS